LETEINYLQNKRDISGHLLKTLLHYHVKRKSSKVHLLCQFESSLRHSVDIEMQETEAV